MLIGGALALTLVGLPWPVGFVVESLDNSRKGYPTPLPPWHDWSTRYIVGLLALLIDFVFFVFPILLGGLVLLCGGLLAIIIAGTQASAAPLLVVGLALIGLFELTMFVLGVAPVGRLLYIDEGRIEDALGSRTLRGALNPAMRGALRQARVRSLPAYLPALLLAGGSWLAWQGSMPGGTVLIVVLTWLTLSALMYAHLVVVQLYAAAVRTSM